MAGSSTFGVSGSKLTRWGSNLHPRELIKAAKDIGSDLPNRFPRLTLA